MHNSTNTPPTERVIRTVRPLTDEELGFMRKILEETPYLSDSDIAAKYHKAGLALDLSMKDLRNKIRHGRKKLTPHTEDADTRVKKISDGYVIFAHKPNYPDGSGNEVLDAEILRKAGFDPDLYIVSSYSESEWNVGENECRAVRYKIRRRNAYEVDPTLAETKCTKEMVQKVFGKSENEPTTEETVEPDAENVKHITPEDLAELYAKVRGDVFNGITTKCEDGQFHLIIPLTDLHIGEGDAVKMTKSYRATFINYILPDIKAKYFAVQGKVSGIDIACLGDLLHCDNGSGTTTAGTALHPKTNVYKSFDEAVEWLTWLIDILMAEFKVPVRVIYTHGNHDNNMGFALIRTVARGYRYINDVEFLINENFVESEDWYTEFEENPEFMHVGYGRVGITYCHGKFIKKNVSQIPEVANRNARRDYDYNVVMYGHLHHLDAASTGANQHNYGLTTPNFVRDAFGKSLGCVTDPEFYVFEVNHLTNRVNFTQYPSLPYNKQPEV